jgi:small GTP-binding protein
MPDRSEFRVNGIISMYPSALNVVFANVSLSLNTFRMSRPLDAPLHKVPFIGDANVGKTSLITRYTTNEFTSAPTATVGVSNVQIKATHGSSEFIINLWDTAGQESFRSLVPLYARGSDVLVLAFSVASIETFKGLDQWFDQIRTDLGITCPIVICGTKTDLQPWQVEILPVKTWAREHNCPLIFTSAQSGDNVAELFGLIAEQLFLARKSGANQADGLLLPPATRKVDCC